MPRGGAHHSAVDDLLRALSTRLPTGWRLGPLTREYLEPGMWSVGIDRSRGMALDAYGTSAEAAVARLSELVDAGVGEAAIDGLAGWSVEIEDRVVDGVPGAVRDLDVDLAGRVAAVGGGLHLSWLPQNRASWRTLERTDDGPAWLWVAGGKRVEVPMVRSWQVVRWIDAERVAVLAGTQDGCQGLVLSVDGRVHAAFDPRGAWNDLLAYDGGVVVTFGDEGGYRSKTDWYWDDDRVAVFDLDGRFVLGYPSLHPGAARGALEFVDIYAVCWAAPGRLAFVGEAHSPLAMLDIAAARERVIALPETLAFVSAVAVTGDVVLFVVYGELWALRPGAGRRPVRLAEDVGQHRWRGMLGGTFMACNPTGYRLLRAVRPEGESTGQLPDDAFCYGAHLQPVT